MQEMVRVQIKGFENAEFDTYQIHLMYWEHIMGSYEAGWHTRTNWVPNNLT